MKIRVSVVIAVIAMIPHTSFMSARTTKNIFVLHMEGARLPANQVASKAIQETLSQEPDNQIFEEYMDENRLDVDDSTIIERIQEKYAGQKMDLILTVGSQALNFMLHHGEKLWPSVPIVFSIVDRSQIPRQLPQNVTGVAGSFDFAQTIDLALKLQPDTRRVFYVGGATEEDKEFRRISEPALKAYSESVDIEYYDGFSLSQLLDRLGRLPEHSIVLFGTYFKDATGQPYTAARVCPLIVGSSTAPVYGTFETYLGCGIVGGSLINLEGSAGQGARMGLRILRGEKIANLPVERGEPNKVVVDWRQLKKWNISESNLPTGVVVMFREIPPFERYKKFFLALFALIAVQTGLIVMLVIQTIRRRRSEKAVRALTRRVISGNEEERRRIAGELHDDIGQRLSLISIQLNSYASHSSKNGGVASGELSDSLSDVDALITDVHNLSHQLHSSKLEHLGLRVALKELCQQIANRHDLPIELLIDQSSVKLPQDISLCFYRVAQEALSNVIKHSGSNKAQVVLAEGQGRLRMQVRDFGVGFKPGGEAAGLGLSTMQERLHIIRGELIVESKPGAGTVVSARAILPVRDQSRSMT
jgi:signal transduction histidine kinase